MLIKLLNIGFPGPGFNLESHITHITLKVFLSCCAKTGPKALPANSSALTLGVLYSGDLDIVDTVTVQAYCGVEVPQFMSSGSLLESGYTF